MAFSYFIHPVAGGVGLYLTTPLTLHLYQGYRAARPFSVGNWRSGRTTKAMVVLAEAPRHAETWEMGQGRHSDRLGRMVRR